MDCSQVEIHAIEEGSVVFPRVPLIRVEGPLLVTFPNQTLQPHSDLEIELVQSDLFTIHLELRKFSLWKTSK